MQGYFVKVMPKIIYPPCILQGERQDCFACGLLQSCQSPRGMCVYQYEGHKKGCPNYGQRKCCPPDAPMFDWVFDVSKPVYAIYAAYNLENSDTADCHEAAKTVLKERIKDFLQEFRPASIGQGAYYVTDFPEAMGIDTTATMKEVGITFEWPAKKLLYKVAFAGVLMDEEYIDILR